VTPPRVIPIEFNAVLLKKIEEKAELIKRMLDSSQTFWEGKKI
jgi:hypothetical protein